MGKQKDEAIRQENNMAIWDKVSTTDPDHTKSVSFGRKFTAIDAHYQVQQATEMFGPVGEGWGYDTTFENIFFTDGRSMVCCDLTFWWSPFETWEGMPAPSHRRTFGPVRGACMLQTLDSKGNPKLPDTDAPKKAMTDALTKCLSHLGFNADVFLGKFDDNKYVQELKKDKEAKQSAAERAYQEDRQAFIDKIKSCKKPNQIDGILSDHTAWLAGLPVATATEVRAWALKIKTELEETSGSE